MSNHLTNPTERTTALPQDVIAKVDAATGYITNIDEIRQANYPLLSETTYLDHAGTTLYAQSLIEAYTKDLTSNLFGNPHSASASSQLSSRRIDDARLQVLQFLRASPEDFDVVFVANATAAVKLIADAFRDVHSGFWYGYHAESHTSLVGVRELASQGSRCFQDDADVESWISSLEREKPEASTPLRLLTYPGQSNMTGHRLPLNWCERLRNVQQNSHNRIYTLFDAAGLLSTSPLDLSNATVAPDFTALSFYKIFGFPDLGALIVKKASGRILENRKYFGGGTVDMVTTLNYTWHEKKSSSLHSQLEDGTLPFHSVLALQSALTIHARIYGEMTTISRHSHFLASFLYHSLANFRHSNGTSVVKIYSHHTSFGDPSVQGPVIAFNLLHSSGAWVAYSEVEKLATVKGIQLRTGGLCNPGGIASHLELSTDEMRQNFNLGQRCGDGNDVINGKPTGAIRVSLGPMSNLADVNKFIEFVDEFYVENTSALVPSFNITAPFSEKHNSCFMVESLSVYPIKSCGAFKIPLGVSWEVGERGLAWDREWCLVHQGTGAALNQKKYPRMALLRPEIDLKSRLLKVSHNIDGMSTKSLEINLNPVSTLSSQISTCGEFTRRDSNVCGSNVGVQMYSSFHISSFFSEALGVPCTLARFPRSGPVRIAQSRMPGSFPGNRGALPNRSIMFSNESPILLVSRSSVNRLNESIKQNNGVGKAVPADSFRGNIVVAEELERFQTESPYIEDDWKSLQIGEDANMVFEVLGPCQRCQMVCVDQKNAQRRQEPFSTLSKTRRMDGKVWFGMHLSLLNADEGEEKGKRLIKVGDRIRPNLGSA